MTTSEKNSIFLFLFEKNHGTQRMRHARPANAGILRHTLRHAHDPAIGIPCNRVVMERWGGLAKAQDSLVVPDAPRAQRFAIN
jgi:hypothetical protein